MDRWRLLWGWAAPKEKDKGVYLKKGDVVRHQEKGETVPLLHEHDPDKVVGFVHSVATNDRTGNHAVLFAIDRESPWGRRAEREYDAGLLGSLSAGLSHDYGTRENGSFGPVRSHITEVSMVVVPDQPGMVIQGEALELIRRHNRSREEDLLVTQEPPSTMSAHPDVDRILREELAKSKGSDAPPTPAPSSIPPVPQAFPDLQDFFRRASTGKPLEEVVNEYPEVHRPALLAWGKRLLDLSTDDMMRRDSQYEEAKKYLIDQEIPEEDAVRALDQVRALPTPDVLGVLTAASKKSAMRQSELSTIQEGYDRHVEKLNKEIGDLKASRDRLLDALASTREVKVGTVASAQEGEKEEPSPDDVATRQRKRARAAMVATKYLASGERVLQ